MARIKFVPRKVATPKELKERWEKKKNQIETLSSNIGRLRRHISEDLKSDEEKTFLTALAIAIIDKTGERVGNEDSASNGNFGVTVLRKKHININGNTITLTYRGKSGVLHDTSFDSSVLAKSLKKAIKNSSGIRIFQTSDGFRIKNDGVNRYLETYDISAKDIRGFRSNDWIIKGLSKQDIPKTEGERKKIFLAVLKKVAEKIGHGKSTLRNHYMIPEIETSYVNDGKIIDISDKEKYEKGGKMKVVSDGKKGGLLYGPTDKDGEKGIKAEVVGGKKVVLGGGEVIINEQAVKENCELLNKINTSTGGREIACNVEGNTSERMLYGGSVGYFGNQISDKKYKWIVDDKNVYNFCGNTRGLKLKDLISHPELFEKYPEIKNVKVFFEEITDKENFNEKIDQANSQVNHGSHYALSTIHLRLFCKYYKENGKEKFELSGQFPESSKESALLHEIQHLLQQKDGRFLGRPYEFYLETYKGGKDWGADIGDIEKIAIAQYKFQPSEQEAMKTVYRWLKSKGLKYDNDEFINWDYEQGEELRNSQGDIYKDGGMVADTTKMESTHSLEEFNELIQQLEVEAKNAAWGNDTVKLIKLNELIGKVIDQRNSIYFNKEGNTNNKMTFGGLVGSKNIPKEGLFIDNNNRERFEIDDSTAIIDYKLLLDFAIESDVDYKEIEIECESILTHWEGYKHYPDIAKMHVLFKPDHEDDPFLFAYKQDEDIIIINSKKLTNHVYRTQTGENPDRKREIGLHLKISNEFRSFINGKFSHELQHAIQHREKTEVTLSNHVQLMSDIKKKYRQESMDDDVFEAWIKKTTGKSYLEIRQEYYENIPSEKEALEVQNRANMSKDERDRKIPDIAIKMNQGGKVIKPTHTLEEFNNLIEVLEDAAKNAVRDNEGIEKITRMNELVDRVKKQRDSTYFNKGGQIENDIKQGDFILPAGHKPFMKVGNGGSSCASCKFLSGKEDNYTCANKYYQKWEGTDKLPDDIDNYCSDWFEPKE